MFGYKVARAFSCHVKKLQAFNVYIDRNKCQRKAERERKRNLYERDVGIGLCVFQCDSLHRCQLTLICAQM